MTDLSGLAQIERDGESTETLTLIEIPTRLDFIEVPRCPNCSRDMIRNGHERIRVFDAPSRGKPVVLDLKKERRRCRPCKHQTTADSHDLVSGNKVLTRRLVRYVENAVSRSPASAVAVETGLSRDHIEQIALELIARLRLPPRHWKTPEIVALDNWQPARGHQYQVLFDQRAGRPISLIRTWEFEPARDEITALLNVEGVRVFVSDMHSTNLLVAEMFTKAVHVADKFHVVQQCNDAVLAVIKARAAALVEAGHSGAAEALRAEASFILRQQMQPAPSAQGTLDLGPLPPELARYNDVAAAYQVKAQLAHFYSSIDRVEAEKALADFFDSIRDPLVARTMRRARDYIRKHERRILAYFDALDLIGASLWSPTTNSLERRNGDLQAIWNSARGFRKDELLWLRALYGSYTFGLHIVECAQCGRFEGPLPKDRVLAISQREITSHDGELCTGCRQSRARTTSPSQESAERASDYGVVA